MTPNRSRAPPHPALACLLVMLCSITGAAAAQARGEIRLGLVAFVGEATNYRALDREYFRDEGLDVRLTRNAAGVQGLRQVMRGEVDIATTAPTPVVYAAMGRFPESPDFRIIACILESSSMNRLVLLDLDRVGGVADLPGKRLALTRATASEYFWYLMALQHGIDRDSVEINDTLGHGAGDRVLLLFSERLRRHLRAVDTVGRLGGDEFVVITEGLGSVADAETTVRKLFKVMSEPVLVAGRPITVDASIGVAVYPGDGETGDPFIRNADAAMYQAKSDGRRGYRFYNKTLTTEMSRRFTLGQDIRRALPANELELHYQPRVQLRDGSTSSVEALLRWRHPRFGLLQPDDFLPDIERASGMAAIDTWAAQEACLQIRRWLDAGHRPPRVSINISAVQLGEPGFDGTITTTLEAQRLSGDALELELTESVLLTNPAQTVAIMRDLQELGVTVSIDDFGTGYSSLSYLQSLPLDTLKIDRAFVASLPRNQNDAAIVRAILALSGQLNLSTVAEGVETAEQVRFLAEAGCDEAQGYFFGRPVPGGEIVACFRPEHFRAMLPRRARA